LVYSAEKQDAVFDIFVSPNPTTSTVDKICFCQLRALSGTIILVKFNVNSHVEATGLVKFVYRSECIHASIYLFNFLIH